MSSAIRFNLDQSKSLSSVSGLRPLLTDRRSNICLNITNYKFIMKMSFVSKPSWNV